MGGDFWVFFLFLLLGFFSVQSQNRGGACNPSDLRALKGFNDSLFSGIVEWSSESDCCGWVGVACDDHTAFSRVSTRRVIRLLLGGKKLGGIVSQSLAGLDQLKELNLSSNFFIGNVPPELFHLRRLEVMDLSHNAFSGSIRINSSSGLPSIRTFNISSNKFNGSQPLVHGSPNLTVFNISYNSFSGPVDTGICNVSTQMVSVDLSANGFSAGFPTGFGKCRLLRKLLLNSNNLSGELPDDIFGLQSLKELYVQQNRLSGKLSDRIGNLLNLTYFDVSVNGFSGIVPEVFGSLKLLQHFAAHSNKLVGSLPASLSNCSRLCLLNLRNNSLHGGVHLDYTVMVNLTSLDLASNHFTGFIPENLSSCTKLRTINFARNNLVGQIPESFENLQGLAYLSLSNNTLSNISAALGVLHKCKSLTTLVLTMNFHGEEMPNKSFYLFENLKTLLIPNCGLSGSIPQWLRASEKLQLLDLSWNHLTGVIPPWIDSFDDLFYLDLSNNSLTGLIPKELTELKSLISSISIYRSTSDSDFPFFIKRNLTANGLQYNQVLSFPPSLDLSNNMLSGPIWPEFGNLVGLHGLDLSRNNLSGTIPDELSKMRSLECLDLSFNDLTGRIPSCLVNLTFLSKFSVANNRLQGLIPVGGQFSTFSSSSYEGNKDLCYDSCRNNTPPGPKHDSASGSRNKTGRKKGIIIGIAASIGAATAIFSVSIFFIMSRPRVKTGDDNESQMDTAKPLELSELVLFQNQGNKEITICDLLKATDNFDQANIIGCGGFGLVYRATLPDGKNVAIKRLSGDCGQMEREFEAEIEALSTAQHKNLVLLQGYCKYGEDRLLIYSYMENGSLDYWLHERSDGGSTLDWDTRLKIAQGAAMGLSYLHQVCQPHILHRDIKSSNILLDERFEAHLADFGLARLILPYHTHVSTDLAGTLGYIPPEYCQASVATFKGDVYSFGIVLLELLTGKRPMDVCKPRGCRDLVSWVRQMKEEKREDEVFDPFVYDKENGNQMLKVLEIACLCLNECPKQRPLIQQIVSWLDNVGFNGQ